MADSPVLMTSEPALPPLLADQHFGFSSSCCTPGSCDAHFSVCLLGIYLVVDLLRIVGGGTLSSTCSTSLIMLEFHVCLFLRNIVKWFGYKWHHSQEECLRSQFSTSHLQSKFKHWLCSVLVDLFHSLCHDFLICGIRGVITSWGPE